MTPLTTALATAVLAGSAVGTAPVALPRDLPPIPSRAASPGAEAQHGAWPLSPDPDVVETFDPPEVSWGAGHRGADLAGTVGQDVRASLPGVVTYAGRIAGRGVVVVSHGAVRTTYEPVAAAVAVGDEVGRAERLGTLELFGSHCHPAACLHWGAIEGEVYLDPLTLVGAGPRPVRLLPAG